ncbi:MAG TPA: hypothetical protein VJ302_27415 [Blastocatellia bacterium]|nr:hypothetical protein [Blastocatellia bacterium]
MDNLGFLDLSLLDVEGRDAADPDTQIEVFRLDGRMLHKFRHLHFPPVQRLQLTAFPQASNLRGEVRPGRYRHCRINFFTLNDEEQRRHRLRVLRDPEKWRARFQPWRELPGHFEPLKELLSVSTIDVIGGAPLGRFVEETYDGVTEPRAIMAKASLLNLFAKLTMVPEPIGRRLPWFHFIRQLLMIGRERLYAVVDEEMGEIVRHLLRHLDRFDHYELADAGLHSQSMRACLPGYQISESEFFSIKTDERYANLQLTLAPARDPQGRDVLLLDADIDENGDLLNHLIDVVLTHPVTGGTHPFDIHEYLLREDRNLQLGYELV